MNYSQVISEIEGCIHCCLFFFIEIFFLSRTRLFYGKLPFNKQYFNKFNKVSKNRIKID